MGVAGLAVPESLGGAGLELLELALVMEELGAGALPGPIFGHALACLAIQLAGSEAQRSRWLPDLASGERIATVAFAEPGDVWDPESWTLASDAANASSGAKRHVPHAALADLIVVGLRGGRFAVVERGAPGVRDRGRARRRPHAPDRRARVRPHARRAARRRARRRRARARRGARAARRRRVRRRVAPRRSSRSTTRRRGSSSARAIAQFQAVKHQLADMATQVEPTRGLFWYAAHAWDQLPAESPRAAAIAKAHITARASEVARAAVELHGGIGFTWECDVQLWFKRAMFDRAWCGTPEHHRARIAALGDW